MARLVALSLYFSRCILSSLLLSKMPPRISSRDVEMSRRPTQNRYPQSRVRLLWSRYCPNLLKILRQIGECCKETWKILVDSVGPVEDNKPTRPHPQTVVWSLLVFLGFLVLASLAVRFPTSNVRLVLVVVSSGILGGLTLAILKDLCTKRTYNALR
jgi:hypothetical protein